MRDKSTSALLLKKATRSFTKEAPTGLLTVQDGKEHVPLTRTRSRDDFDLDYSASSSIRDSEDGANGGGGVNVGMTASLSAFASSPSLNANQHLLGHHEKGEKTVTLSLAVSDSPKERVRRGRDHHDKEEKREGGESRERSKERERKDRMQGVEEGSRVSLHPSSGPVAPRHAKSKSLTLSVPKLSLLFKPGQQDSKAPHSPKASSETAPNSPLHKSPHSPNTATTPINPALHLTLPQYSTSDPTLNTEAAQRRRAGSTEAPTRQVKTEPNAIAKVEREREKPETTVKDHKPEKEGKREEKAEAKKDAVTSPAVSPRQWVSSQPALATCHSQSLSSDKERGGSSGSLNLKEPESATTLTTTTTMTTTALSHVPDRSHVSLTQPSISTSQAFASSPMLGSSAKAESATTSHPHDMAAGNSTSAAHLNVQGDHGHEISGRGIGALISVLLFYCLHFCYFFSPPVFACFVDC
jgi:hypothetical protein